MDKKSLRQSALARRGGISIIEIAELSARISLNALNLREYKDARRVLCYSSYKSEVGTRGLLRQILMDGKELYVPMMKNRREMDAVRLHGLNDLAPNQHGILEPRIGEAVDPKALDILFIPGVAFDARGGRLGYGAGYFDRYLQKSTGVFAALAYELQLTEEIPMDAHDVKMRYIVTERMIYDCGLEGFK